MVHLELKMESLWSEAMDNTDKKTFTFDEVLTDNDYGLIIDGRTGELRGLFIPHGSKEDEVPETIVTVCRDFFGIDPNENVIYH